MKRSHSAPRSNGIYAGLLCVLALFAPARARAQTACGASSGLDVVIREINGPMNVVSQNGIDALVLGFRELNVGTAPVVYSAFTNQHPVFGGGLYRLKVVDGASRFEMVGLSWLRHAFFALSEGTYCTCSPTNGTTLGVGCTSTNSVTSEGQQQSAGPRWQVNAFTGSFPYPPANPPFSGSLARRLQVHVSDLELTGAPGSARYFVEEAVIAPDDAAAGHGENNAAWREVVTSQNGSEWFFGLTGSTRSEQPAMRAWQEADPLVQITEVQVPSEGVFLLGHRTTDLGGGLWHYEYALYDVNSDLAAQSFSLALPTDVAISNLGFHDVDYHSGDGIGNVNQSGLDWQVTLSGGALRWESESFAQDPNGNALRWGTLYNFRFDADTPPIAGTVTIGSFEQPGSVTAAADVPSTSGSPGEITCAGDGLDPLLTTPCPCANTGALQHGCANSGNDDGARLLSSGSTNPDTVVLTASGELPSVLSFLLQGDMELTSGIIFGDGIRCAGGTLKRLFMHNASGGTVVFPGAGDPSISAQSAALGDPIAPGSTRIYQTYYRDPDLAFCPSPPGNAWNVTNALRVTW